MMLRHVKQLVAAGCLISLSAGCEDTGVVGSVETSRPPSGLYLSQGNGAQVCFNVAPGGEQLRPSFDCDLDSQIEANAYQIRAELLGIDGNGDGCSLEFGFAGDVPIDQETGTFRAGELRLSGSDAVFSFLGEITDARASGVARRQTDGAFCEVGWGATRAARCDADADRKCTELLDCCRAILINPVFLQSCQAVVDRCDELECQQALDGYEQCASPEPDAGADAG